MLPTRIMSKVNEYKIGMKGISVMVRVIDREELLESGIAELRSRGPLYVGFDFKKQETVYPSRLEAVLFLLHAEDLCLIIQMQHFQSIPESLKLFLANEDICFVGPDLDGVEFCVQQYGGELEEQPESNVELQCKTAVEPRFFAAMMLKKPWLMGSSMADVGSKIGVDIEGGNPSPPSARFEWDDPVFSHEDVKYVIRDVYGYYQIAEKLGNMI